MPAYQHNCQIMLSMPALGYFAVHVQSAPLYDYGRNAIPEGNREKLVCFLCRIYPSVLARSFSA